MEESSNRRGGGVIVVVLVLMALASLQGVSSLVSDNTDPLRGEGSAGEPEGAEVAVEPSATVDLEDLMPSPEPSLSQKSPKPEPDDGVDVAGLRFVRAAHPYPKVCLRQVSSPTVGEAGGVPGRHGVDRCTGLGFRCSDQHAEADRVEPQRRVPSHRAR